MKISDALSLDAIELDVTLNSQEEAIERLVALQYAAGNIDDVDAFKQAVIDREAKATTAVGGGLAVPHAQCSAVVKPGLSVVTVPKGVEYHAPDQQPVKLFFMIAAQDHGPLHFELLARLVTLLIDENIVKSLLEAKSKEAFIDIIIQSDMKKFPGETYVYEPFDEEELKAIAQEGKGIVHRTFKAFRKRMANMRKK